jgi:hypothetical protein
MSKYVRCLYPDNPRRDRLIFPMEKYLEGRLMAGQLSEPTENMEELFDEIVVVSYKNNGRLDGLPALLGDKKTIHSEDFRERFDFLAGCNAAKVYGAVWTDEGLIYAAKLNKKGVFELL